MFQAVHAEMEEALHQKDELKLRVQSYISEVARIESLMAAKVSATLKSVSGNSVKLQFCEPVTVKIAAL